MAPPYEEKQASDVEKLDVLPSDKATRELEAANKSPEEKALVRKIDLYLMPSIWFLYLLAVHTPPPNTQDS